jgi:hypothetical protein
VNPAATARFPSCSVRACRTQLCLTIAPVGRRLGWALNALDVRGSRRPCHAVATRFFCPFPPFLRCFPLSAARQEVEIVWQRKHAFPFHCPRVLALARHCARLAAQVRCLRLSHSQSFASRLRLLALSPQRPTGYQPIHWHEFARFVPPYARKALISDTGTSAKNAVSRTAKLE